MSFAAQGVVPPIAAFALVRGANIGTAINRVIEGGAGNDPAACRLPIGNLLIRVIGVIAALAVLPFLSRLTVIVEPDNARAVTNSHTAFNVALALTFFPLPALHCRFARTRKSTEAVRARWPSLSCSRQARAPAARNRAG